MSVRISTRLKTVLLFCAACMEPVCHSLGIPHPEGLPNQLASILITTDHDH